MSESKIAEIFVFEDTFFFTTKVQVRRVEEERIALSTTPLLSKFALLGKKIYMRYSTFALPVRVVGKSDKEILVTLPFLSPEKHVGDRKAVRVRPSPTHPVRLYIGAEGEEVQREVEDISEGGFSIVLRDPSEVDRYIGKEVDIRIDFPVEAQEVKGRAKMVNIQESPEGEVKLGFELFIDDADMVKVRFYVYSRVREILRE